MQTIGAALKLLIKSKQPNIDLEITLELSPIGKLWNIVAETLFPVDVLSCFPV